jgi:hypothetical protein
VRPRDLYALLGVRPEASTDEIAAAFRERAKALHPDAAPGDPDAAEEFKTLSRAYATLRSPRSRAAYDARRRRAAAQRGDAWGPAPRRAGSTPPRPPRISTRAGARWAIAGGIFCIVAGILGAPVLLSIETSPDTVGRDVTLWIVVAKLLICGVILVGAGWWRLSSLRATTLGSTALRSTAGRTPPGPTPPRTGPPIPTGR